MVVYNIRLGVTVLVLVLMIPGLLAVVDWTYVESTTPGLNPELGIGSIIGVLVIWSLVIILIRFILPRIEFYNDFARCERGFGEPNDIPYSVMRLTFEQTRNSRMTRTLIWDNRQPFLSPYRVGKRTIRSLNITISDWLQSKVNEAQWSGSGKHSEQDFRPSN